MTAQRRTHPGNGNDTGPPPWSGQTRSRKLGLLRWLPDAWVQTAGDRTRRVLYLTFDDGPHPEHTPRLLDLLATHGVRATFFLIGERAERNPGIVRRTIAAGHRLGNHSWSHPDFARIDVAAQRAEIDRTDRLLRSFDGCDRHAFRPPRGAVSPALLLDALRAGRRLAYWTYDSLDYSHRDPAQLVANAAARPVRPGDVILMHDDSAHSLQMLQALIPRWKAAGYGFDALPSPGAAPGAPVASRPADAAE